jgi:hypothetical protein
MPSLPQAFGISRMLIGLVSWVAPSLTARVFGLDPRSRQPIVTQLFGARELALGYMTATTSGTSREAVLRAGVAIDAVDALASARQIRAGAFGPHAIVTVALGAVFFAGLGVVALRREEAPGP